MSGRLVAVLALLAVVACAGTTPERKYPRRRAGCELKIYHTPIPEAVTWDDIGPLEVGCELDEGEVMCIHRLRAEACKMGGDMIYAVPKRASRPTERAMVYRGMVAHSRELPPKPDDDKHAEAHPGDAGSGPVIPLGAPAVEPLVAPSDGGSDGAI
jgi:hypothetical protein